MVDRPRAKFRAESHALFYGKERLDDGFDRNFPGLKLNSPPLHIKGLSFSPSVKDGLFGRRPMVLNGMPWRHRQPIFFLPNLLDAILLQHLLRLSTVVRRGIVWPKVVWAIMGLLLDERDDITGKDLSIDSALTALFWGAKKSRERPFIDMVMRRCVQSFHARNHPRSSSRYVGRFFSPSHRMRRSAMWWISGHSHGYGGKTHEVAITVTRRLWWHDKNTVRRVKKGVKN